jgi:hypothetical protein
LEIFRHETSHMVLSIIFLEDKHKFVLHLSIFYEYQMCSHMTCLISNRAAVSRNRYGVEKTVDTHKILINAIQIYVCLQEI